MLSFKKGVRLPDHKLTTSSPARSIEMAKRLVLPLQQHCGAPASPTVNEGDSVTGYQKIAEPGGKVSAALHAPTSGTIKRVSQDDDSGHYIEIEPDGKHQCAPMKKLSLKSSLAELRERIREAGIVGLGGACFPTDVKVTVPEGKHPDVLIINACECEPYVTADDRMMREHPKEVIQGITYLMRASGVNKTIVGIEENKPDAAQKLQQAIGKKDNISIRTVKTKYPQGAEKMLVYAVTGRKVPRGCIPLEAGAIVNNVSTAKSVADAVFDGIPLVERYVTVTGDVRSPLNFRAPLGTPVQQLIDESGGPSPEASKVLTGGPMMGSALADTTKPIKKGTNCVLVQARSGNASYAHCIRCGACVQHCPMQLMPSKIAAAVKKGQYGKAEEFYIHDCFECGTCAYVCPSRIPLTQYIRLGKQELNR